MKKRKINRSLLFLILMGVIVTIVAMSVVYAALSTKLLISGSTEVSSSSFELKVEKLLMSEIYGDDYKNLCLSYGQICDDNYSKKGNGDILSFPVISDTSINNFKLSIQLPGDQAVVSYKVINDGTIPMKLNRVIGSTPQITSLSNNSSDVDWVNENVEFVSVLEKTKGTSININDILCPGDDWIIYFGATIPDDVTTIPSGAIEISNIGVSYEFLQTDQYLCD